MKRSSCEHLLHLLYAHQQQHRFISDEAINDIASELSLARAQVESVVEFYSFFSRTPRGRFDILFSNCTSCGDRSLMEKLCALIHVEQGVMRDDGLVSIGETSCIGMCDHGASALINGRSMTGMDEHRINAMAELVESGKVLIEWPDEWFEVNDHIRCTGLLLSESFESGSALKVVASEGVEPVLEKIKHSELRGRGGAGFSTAQKWKFCREAAG
ncbi:NAD(P)H-dependent oxidoreductase subunit E, partial [Pseudomonadota bacterium]